MTITITTEQYIEKAKEKWLGFTVGDYECIDITTKPCNRGDHVGISTALVIKCKVCGNVKTVLPNVFQLGTNKHNLVNCSNSSEAKIETLKKLWIGKTAGDYTCVDVIEKQVKKNNSENHVNTFLRLKCNICGNELDVLPCSFVRGKYRHNRQTCYLNDPDKFLAEFKSKWVGTKRGDYECVDAVINPKSSSADVLAQCMICGNKKQMELSNFLHSQSNHPFACENFSKHIGEIRGDMKILDIFKAGPHSLKYHVQCQKCGKIHETSCGCVLNRKANSHEILCTIGMGTTRFRSLWYLMHRRCTGKSKRDWDDYYGRGIRDEFKNFEDFYEHMWPSYKALADKIGERNVSIERIDVNGNYNPENCTWIDIHDQASNRRSTLYFKAVDRNGLIYYDRNVRRFCEKHGLRSSEFFKVLKQEAESYEGWTGNFVSKKEWERNSLRQLSWESTFAVSIIHDILSVRKIVGDTNCRILFQELYDRGVRLNSRIIDELTSSSNKHYYEFKFNLQENYLDIQEGQSPSV